MRSKSRSIVTVIPIGVLALLLVAAGCAQEEERDQQPGRQGAQRLVVAATQDEYETKGPEANVGQYPVNANIFETLARMDEDYNLTPLLATSWEFKPPNTWRFELKRGVTFHDGQAFDARAVKYTFDRIAKAGGGTGGIGEDSTKIIDDFTIEVTPTYENRHLPEQLVHPETSILAPGSDPAKKPVGTGPFKFVSYEPQQQIVVERNEDYWGSKSELERITFRFIPEPNARRLALEAGEASVALDVPREAVENLRAKNFVVDTSPPGAYEAMYANISGKKGYTILTDLKVRQAVAHAIDRQSLVQGVLEGLASAEQTMVPARLLGEAADNVEGFNYDPQRAGQLLDEAGWTAGEDGIRQKGGKRLTLQLINGFPNAQAHGAVPQFIQDQLKAVGIDVEIIEAPDTGAYEQRLDALEGDLWLEQGNQNDANPAFLPALLFWSKGLFGNIGYQPLFAPNNFIPGSRFDTVIKEALATADPQETKSTVAEAMHILIDENVVVIPLAGIFRIHATTEDVEGFQAHPSTLQVRYDEVGLTG